MPPQPKPAIHTHNYCIRRFACKFRKSLAQGSSPYSFTNHYPSAVSTCFSAEPKKIHYYDQKQRVIPEKRQVLRTCAKCTHTCLLAFPHHDTNPDASPHHSVKSGKLASTQLLVFTCVHRFFVSLKNVLIALSILKQTLRPQLTT